MLTPLFLTGLGPLKIALILSFVAMLFRASIVKRFGERVGRWVGATDRSVEEFEAGREAE